MNLFVFSLPVELILQPALILIAMIIAVAETDPKFHLVRRLFEGLSVVVGLTILASTLRVAFDEWDTLDRGFAAREFLLPIWMTSLFMPWAYLLGLISNYEWVFMRIDLARTSEPRWRAKLAIVVSLRMRFRLVNLFAGRWPNRLAESRSWREARQVVKDFKKDPTALPKFVDER